MSKFSIKAPVQVVDQRVLYEELGNCDCFKLIAFKQLQMPFRHTGFLLFFDNVPKYTINVRTGEFGGPESNTLRQCSTGCRLSLCVAP